MKQFFLYSVLFLSFALLVFLLAVSFYPINTKTENESKKSGETTIILYDVIVSETQILIQERITE